MTYNTRNILLSHTLVYSIIGDGDLDFCDYRRLKKRCKKKTLIR